jgi:hypothetical protein
VSRHPGPPPSCAQDPPQGRSRHRAIGHREAKVADAEFFVRRECLSSASLLRRFPSPAEPSTSFASPMCRSPTSPAPTSTLPPASHQHPPPLRSVVVARRRQRASRLPIPQIGTSSWASSPTPPCFTSSPAATGIGRRAAARRRGRNPLLRPQAERSRWAGPLHPGWAELAQCLFIISIRIYSFQIQI